MADYKRRIADRLLERKVLSTGYRSLFVVILTLMGSMNALAGVLHLEITFVKGTELADIDFFIGDDAGATEAQKMVCNGTKLTADIQESANGFYSLTCVIQGGQVNTPLYIAKGTAKKSLKAEMADSFFPVITNDADCKALSQYGHLQGMQTRRLWMEAKTEDDAKAILTGYKDIVAQAVADAKVSDIVKKYVDVWAYATNYVNVSNVAQILRKKPKEVALKPADIMPAAAEVMDSELALSMSSASFIICDDLGRHATLDDKITALRSSYKTEAIVQKVTQSLMENYITNFDYQNHYAEGLAELSEVTKKYDLPDTYLADFQKRSSALSGAAFPEGVNLVDKDGNKMDFAQFRGKYVYVDFWASWCVPCCKEVPHLQKLESELKNDNVVFLSISIDSSKEPWLKKMADLNMHGNQWLNADNKVCEALNINGVPHFAIYNKEGKLMVNDADRPSSGEELKNFLEMLK